MSNSSPDNPTNCRSCDGDTRFFEFSKILEYEATYTICTKCSSVQVENPTWLEYAHSKAISIFDTGLVFRCLSASRLISCLLSYEGKLRAKGIDWGGGTGLFTRLMRDKGFDVSSYDIYATAEHAAGFEANKEDFSKNLCFITSIECFEHLLSPIEQFRLATSNAEYFFFTTEIIKTPPPSPKNNEWWYFMPDSGQHITFISSLGINNFKQELGFDYYVSFGSMHVFSRKKLKLRTRFFMQIRVSRILSILLIPEFLSKKFTLTLSDQNELMKKAYE